ncbi:hypothetical protein V8E36_008414 [Tilletia maclaganii]
MQGGNDRPLRPVITPRPATGYLAGPLHLKMGHRRLRAIIRPEQASVLGGSCPCHHPSTFLAAAGGPLIAPSDRPLHARAPVTQPAHRIDPGSAPLRLGVPLGQSPSAYAIFFAPLRVSARSATTSARPFAQRAFGRLTNLQPAPTTLSASTRSRVKLSSPTALLALHFGVARRAIDSDDVRPPSSFNFSAPLGAPGVKMRHCG